MSDYTVTRNDYGNDRHAEILEDDESIEIVAWDDKQPGETYVVYDKETDQTTIEKFP